MNNPIRSWLKRREQVVELTEAADMLLHATMYKDHPLESRRVINALKAIRGEEITVTPSQIASNEEIEEKRSPAISATIRRATMQRIMEAKGGNDE